MAWERSALDSVPDSPSPLMWAHSRGLSIAILRHGEIASERWAAFLRSFAQTPTTRMLLFVLGPVDLPPARRRALIQAIGERHVASIVDSVIGRGMVTSLSWSGVSVESFSISRIREALSALDPESDGESIEQCLDFAARLIEGTDLSVPMRNKLVGNARARARVSALR